MSATDERQSDTLMQSLIARVVAEAKRSRPLILVAEDKPEAAAALAATLGQYGMQTLLAQDVFEVFAALQDRPVSAVVINQSLGPIDTVALLPQFRRTTQAPILVQAARFTESDRILALELGADDAMAHSISGRELVARLRACLRRRHRSGSLPSLQSTPAPDDMSASVSQLVERLGLGPAGLTGGGWPPGPGSAVPPTSTRAADGGTTRWRLLHSERRLYRPDGSVLALTSAEFDLLAALNAMPGEVRSREALTEIIFRRSWRANDRAVDNVVVRLRAKLVPELGAACIATVRQRGYLFSGFPPA